VRLRDHVYAYELDWNYDEPLGVHVLELPTATLLFGAGTAGTAGQLVEELEGHEVDAVVVEHGHPDHFGGVPALRETLGLEVAAPQGDLPLLREAGIEVDHPLRPGESYMGITPIGVPGHTRGNMSFHGDDLIVTGDTVVGSDSLFAGEGNWSGKLAVISDDFNDDTERLVEHLPDLLNHSFDTLLLSHGSNVLHDGQQAMLRLLEDLRSGGFPAAHHAPGGDRS